MIRCPDCDGELKPVQSGDILVCYRCEECDREFDPFDIEDASL